MCNEKEKRQWKLNNSGAAILTVIIVVTFISIIATIMLYLSGMNFYMKTTDLQTKESFYEAETALEELRAALAVEVSNASAAAYDDIMYNYASADAATRQMSFQTTFMNELKSSWDTKAQAYAAVGATPGTTEYFKVIQSYVDSVYYTGNNTLGPDASNPTAGTMVLDSANGVVYLKGIELVYTDSDNYTTMISTDFAIEIPPMNWSVDSNPDSITDPSDLVRQEINFSNYVKYSNWTKK